MAVLQSASPAWVGRIAPLDVVVVVAVLDHLALVVEAQHRHSRVAEVLALLGPAGPPFDRDYETLRIGMQNLFHDLGITVAAA